jgi:hypothetical protein
MATNRTTSLVAFLWVLPVTVFAYFSFVKPWPVAEQALENLELGPRLVVALSGQASLSSASSYSYRTQTYLLLPDSLRTLKAYEVIQERTVVRVNTIPFGLIIFGGFYAVWIGTSVWYVSAVSLTQKNRRTRSRA